MNIQNIATLAGKLEGLGFENMGYLLLKNISFRPQNFCLVVKASQLNNALNFHLFIQRNGINNEYDLLYYDANLLADSNTGEQVIHGIDIAELRTAMTRIDWNSAFDLTAGKNLSLNELSNLEKEEEVEAVIEKLQVLEKSENGKSVATSLKLDFWAGLPYQELFGNIAPVKRKYEISQRFYCPTGQPCISIDEAYRFLQNRLLEKQISQRKKQPENLETDEADANNQPASGSGLLQKKRNKGKQSLKKQRT